MDELTQVRVSTMFDHFLDHEEGVLILDNVREEIGCAELLDEFCDYILRSSYDTALNHI